MKKQIYIWLAAAGFLLLSACGPKQPVLPTEAPEPTGMEWTETVSPTESVPPETSPVPPTGGVKPEPTKEPEPVKNPTPTPEPTRVPGPTEAPGPTEKPELTEAPEPTEKPEPTKAPEPTEEPEPTKAPEPTEEPEPTKVPEPTEKPEPTKAPEPTEKPEPTKAPEPTEEPEPTKAPEPTEEPEPTETPEPTKEPTPTVAPEVLIQNGWQKTVSITECYHIFLPDLFDSSEVIRSGQELWVRYTSTKNEAITFYIGYTMGRTLEEQKEHLEEEGAVFLTLSMVKSGSQYLISDETNLYHAVLVEEQYGMDLLGTAFGEEQVTGIMQVIFAFPKDKTEYTTEQYQFYVQTAPQL